MKSFTKKTKLSYVAMMHLIFETGRLEILNVVDCLNASGCTYDKEVAEVNCVGLIYEICRYELYKDNPKEKVDIVMNKVYDQFKFNISSEKKEQYLSILKVLIEKMSEIFSQEKLLAPRENFIYRLFLEQINIKESSIKSVYVQNLAYLAKRWIMMGESIKNSYYIDDTEEEMAQKDTIDYSF